MRIQEGLDLPQEGQLTGLGGFDEQRVLVFAEVEAQKIESVRNVGNARFLAVQLHAGMRPQPVSHDGNEPLGLLLRLTGDDEIVRVADDMDADAATAGTPSVSADKLFQVCFQTMEGDIGKHG